jgi:Restriction endonuclease
MGIQMDFDSVVEEELASTMTALLEEGTDGVFKLVFMCLVFGLNHELIVKPNPDIHSFLESVRRDPISLWREIMRHLDEQMVPSEFQRGLPIGPKRDLLIESFFLTRKARYIVFASLLLNFDYNVQALKQYRPRLSALRTQALKKDKWGDLDETEWHRVLREFVKEKFAPASIEANDTIKRAPGELRTYLQSKDQLDMVLRFARVAYDSKLGFQDDNPEALEESETLTTPEPIVTGEDFEQHIKRLIESSLNWLQVETTPRTGDHGADLIVHADGFRIAIQAKYYAGSVGNGAVQEIYSAKDFYDAEHAIVVTSSEYTPAARILAGKLGVILAHESEIVDIVATLVEM